MPAITLVGFIGTPIYIYNQGLALSELILFLVYLNATALSITVGYHRLFSHATFKTNAFMQFFFLFFGAATFQKSALRWASQHRQHHQFTDTDLDPHNSLKGYFYCHAGWIMFYKHHVNFANVKDLTSQKMIKHQHDYYDLWSLTAGLVLPLFIGWATGHLLGAFIMSFCLRVSLVLNMAFFINSSAHRVGGKKTYDKNASARDSWFWALLTNGEGYHSFHHKFPNDYRNGVLKNQWDPSKWFIYSLSLLGWAWDLKRTPVNLLKAAQAQS